MPLHDVKSDLLLLLILVLVLCCENNRANTLLCMGLEQIYVIYDFVVHYFHRSESQSWHLANQPRTVKQVKWLKLQYHHPLRELHLRL